MRSVSKQTLERLPAYLNYLKSLPEDEAPNISATIIAEELGLNDVQVRKDLAMISSGGRPKVGYITAGLIQDIEQFLGYGNADRAVIVGAGHLGQALLCYHGFSEYGLEVVAAFDADQEKCGIKIDGKPVLPMEKLPDLCRRMNIRMGIITAPAPAAQEVCDRLIESGIMAVWNFAPVHLKVPKNVLVQNENMAYSLAVLSKHLIEKMGESQSTGGCT